MSYDFDTPVDRHGSMSYKWDTTPDGVLPLWVADMDFKAAPCIIDALRRRVEHGVFGYVSVPDEYYQAVDKWFTRRHGWSVNREHVIYTSGVVPAVSACLKALTKPGDRVIVQTPAYNCFFSSIRNNGCELSANRLIYHPDGYTIDWEDLERRAADPLATVLILCNPHNPSGRVWTRDELLRIADICLRNNVFVISDEIHCELVYDTIRYTPYGSLGEEIARQGVVCISPSKAFNIAGLQIANIVAPDSDIRARIDRAINDNEVCDVNPFGVTATIAAYNEGESWLEELLTYIRGNMDFLTDYLRKNIPDLKPVPLEGTYLAWIECSATGMNGDSLELFLIDRAGVRLNSGSMYGPGGEDFVRMNLACPKCVLSEALDRMKMALTRV
ncbi:MAG: pyridoxal phosphate-dependent aminotransferase [Muribaculaceae bacterium]|nr:pyridoxal phosphate-dependent aminotransferase [Muribaculaceae bacterium]